MRFTVAMGRAIVREPEVFLFDEPLSNLDALLRVQMRIEIKRLHKRLNATSIFVTHDQPDTKTGPRPLADREEEPKYLSTSALSNNGRGVPVRSAPLSVGMG